MTEQQTPASVDLMIVRRIAEGLRRKAVEYRKGDKPQRAEGCDEDADALERVASRLERLSAEREGLREAAQTAHDTLIELNPSNYDHGDVCQANAASVEAILILADALGQRHGKTDEWWSARRAALTQGESRQTGWRLAPVEPTEAMMKAWNDYRHNASGVVAWEAMIAALPAAPTPADRDAIIAKGEGR